MNRSKVKVECEEATLQVEPPITRQPNDGERNRLKSNLRAEGRAEGKVAGAECATLPTAAV